MSFRGVKCVGILMLNERLRLPHCGYIYKKRNHCSYKASRNVCAKNFFCFMGLQHFIHNSNINNSSGLKLSHLNKCIFSLRDCHAALAMAILFMGLTRYARNDNFLRGKNSCSFTDTGMLEGIKLPLITYDDPDLHKKGKKKVAPFSGSHFFRS